MKHLKTFENNNEVQIGDYVVCEEDDSLISKDDEIIIFTSNNIGKLIDLDYSNMEYSYVVQYENIPADLRGMYFSTKKNTKKL